MTPQETIAHLQSQLDECRKENKFLVADYRRVQKQKLKVERELCHEIAARKIRQQLAAHCAAATAKERQARELAEGENARLREAVEYATRKLSLVRCDTDYAQRLVDDAYDRLLAPAPAGGKP